MKHEYSAGVVVYYQEDHNRFYLLLHYGTGHWDFPKGHIEKGEKKEETALRELQEEAGITATLIKGFEYSFDYIFRNKQHELCKKTVYFFVGKTTQKKITLSFEHSEYLWLTFEDAIQQLTFDNAKKLLTEAEQFLKINHR